MRVTKVREVAFNTSEWHSLLSILAYTGELVEYKDGAPQHESLKILAQQMHTELTRADEDI